MNVRSVLGCAAFGLAAAGAVAPAGLFGQPIQVRVVTEGTILRERPDAQAAALKILPLGSLLNAEATESPQWIRVRLGPDPSGAVLIGYVPRDNVEVLTVPAGDPKTTPPSLPPDTRLPETLTPPGGGPGGLRSFGAHAVVGLAGVGPMDDPDYYEGFTSGLAAEFGLRYFFKGAGGRLSRFFLGLSYQRSSVATDLEPILLAFDEQGDELYALFNPLLVQSVFLEIGRTSKLLGKGTFFYIIMGLGYTRHSGTTTGEWRTPSGAVLARTEAAYHDNRMPLRIKIGTVLGFSSRIGLEIGLRGDALLADVKDFTGVSRITVWGSLVGVDIGLHFNL